MGKSFKDMIKDGEFSKITITPDRAVVVLEKGKTVKMTAESFFEGLVRKREKEEKSVKGK